MMSGELELFKAQANQIASISDNDLSELFRVNNEIREKTGTPLIDIELLKQLAVMRANPELYNTALPEVEAGHEVIVDIFCQKKPVVISSSS